MNRTRRWRSALVAGLLAVCLPAGGCSLVGDIRREAPARSTAPAPPQASPTLGNWVVQRRAGTAQVREDVLPVPSAYDRRGVEFADASFGAALFAQCAATECTARLFVTVNGGWAWQERVHPLPGGADQQLHVGADRSVVLLAAGDWFVSVDAAVTFTRRAGGDRPPPEYQRLYGPVQVCCDGDAQPRVMRWVGDGSMPVPTPPPLPGRVAAATGRDEQLWAVSLDGGRPVAAASADGGRTWTATPLPGADRLGTAGALDVVRLGPAVADGDVWLIGQRGDRTGFPELWRWAAGAWARMPAGGHPETFTAAAPLGRGLLAVTGPAGAGVAGERYTPTDWPAGGAIRLLADGALKVTDERDGTIWLGTGPGVDRRWAQLVLHTS